jgi:hypothetical protein
VTSQGDNTGALVNDTIAVVARSTSLHWPLCAHRAGLDVERLCAVATHPRASRTAAIRSSNADDGTVRS